MYCCAADVAGDEEERSKLTKLMTLWESKGKFFSEEKLETMRNPGRMMKTYRSKLEEEFAELVEPHEKATSATYNGFKHQHQQFVDHANNSVEQQQQQLEQLQQQYENIKGKHEQEMRAWQAANPGHGSPSPAAPAPSGGGRRSRWDRTAAQEASGSRGPTLPDTSRPPPVLATPPPQSKIPSLPYFELPAGLMVPLVKMEASGYKPLDPSLIRLPPPQPPNERLLAAVELFYCPPSHERPRDPEGWERLGLYEWARDKADSVQRKKVRKLKLFPKIH